ncbi:hypothetical protein MRX96_036564 [Rhipicephalus microplus]
MLATPKLVAVIDATPKYLNGMLQGTLSDLGAYDKCIETVLRGENGATKLRGQYCDVHLSLGDDDAFLESLLPFVLYSHTKSTMPHLWYLSADFQLFAVAVAVIQTSGRKKRLAAVAFAILSLLCCFMSAWQLYGSNMLPFIVPLHTSYKYPTVSSSLYGATFWVTYNVSPVNFPWLT